MKADKRQANACERVYTKGGIGVVVQGLGEPCRKELGLLENASSTARYSITLSNSKEADPHMDKWKMRPPTDKVGVRTPQIYTKIWFYKYTQKGGHTGPMRAWANSTEYRMIKAAGMGSKLDGEKTGWEISLFEPLQD